jgi:hypothetical protein
MKYSKVSGVVRWSGGTLLLGKNDSIDDNHPLVAERPDLFTDEAPPAKHRGPAQPDEPLVERATNRPGTRRGGPGR